MAQVSVSPIVVRKKSAQYERARELLARHSRFRRRLPRAKKSVRGGAALHRFVRWRWRKKAAGSPARRRLRLEPGPHALSLTAALKARCKTWRARACLRLDERKCSGKHKMRRRAI